MSDAEHSADAAHDHDHDHEGPGYATPQAAIEASEPEELAYVMGLYVGTDVDAPDFLAVVDLDPDSATYTEVVDRVEMPDRGDELHHFGWNACSSSCHVGGLERRHLVIPGQRSSRIHVVDTVDRREPELERVIEPEAVFDEDLSAPHTDDTGDTMHDQTIRDHINRIADRAGLEKNVYPHLFRHTAITRLALEDLNEQQIKQTVDWDGDSSQFSTYVTLADELTNDSIREKLGYPTSPGGTPIIGRPTLNRCDECGEGFPEGAERCPNCEQPLTHRAEEETDASVPDEGGITAEDHGRHDAELLADFANSLGVWMKQEAQSDDGAEPLEMADAMTQISPDEVSELMNTDD